MFQFPCLLTGSTSDVSLATFQSIVQVCWYTSLSSPVSYIPDAPLDGQICSLPDTIWSRFMPFKTIHITIGHKWVWGFSFFLLCLTQFAPITCFPLRVVAGVLPHLGNPAHQAWWLLHFFPFWEHPKWISVLHLSTTHNISSPVGSGCHRPLPGMPSPRHGPMHILHSNIFAQCFNWFSLVKW